MNVKATAKQFFYHVFPRRPIILPILLGPIAGRLLWTKWAYSPQKLFGRHEPDVLRPVLQLIKPGHVVFDIGANDGYVSMLMTHRVGRKGRIYAFEPAPNAFQMLVANCLLNQKMPTHPYQVAVADHDGTEVFSYFDYDGVSRMGDWSAQYNDAVVTHVQVKSIDSFIRDFRTGKPDFVKIDVEGAEMLVLRGMHDLLTTRRPTLLLEAHSAQLREEVMVFLGSLGYKLKILRSGIPCYILAHVS